MQGVTLPIEFIHHPQISGATNNVEIYYAAQECDATDDASSNTAGQ